MRRRRLAETPPRPRADQPGPQRTCVGCRARAALVDLVRVVAVDDALVLDVRRRLPGRGAHLHPDPRCLEAAERRRAFPRALRRNPGSATPLDIAGLRRALDEALERRTTGPSEG